MKKEKFFTGKGQVILLALISTLLWGSAFPCVKKGYEIFQIANGDMGSQMLFAEAALFHFGRFSRLSFLTAARNFSERPCFFSR